MKQLDICENILNLIKSYLTDRKQLVVIKGKKMDAIGLETIIPWWLKLDPLLFSLYVNDFVDSISSDPFLLQMTQHH